MKISVIVAAYNAEKYLAEAIYSALNQTFDSNEYEVIVVNDGSTDETEGILEAYSKKYSNLKVINKENAGPSSARNLGISEAQGEYIYFFDADDIMEKDALEALYNRITEQEADLVIAGYDIFSKAGTSNVKAIVPMLSLDSIDKYDTRILWTFALWNKLLKKSIIDENSLTFPPFSYSEDGAFIMSYIFNTKKITGLDKIVLHYRKMYDDTSSSITATVSKNKIEDYLKAHEYINQRIIEQKDEIEHYDIYINEFYRKTVQILINQFYNQALLTDDECVKMISDSIRSYCNKMNYATKTLLQSQNPDVPLHNLGSSKEDMLRHKYITAVLYGNDEKFTGCLRSIINQNLIGIKIIVPEKSRESIETAGLLVDSIEFIPAESEKELFSLALSSVDTEIIIFCDSNFVYSTNAFRVANRRYMKDGYDFLTGAVYAEGSPAQYPIEINNRVIEEYSTGLQTEGITSFDCLLANKFFSVDFLKAINADVNSKDFIDLCYSKGCYYKTSNKQLTFSGTEADFLNYLNNEKANRLYSKTEGESVKILGKRDNTELKNQVCIVYSKDAIRDNGKVLKHLLKSKAKVFEIESKADLTDSKLNNTIAESSVIVTNIMLPCLKDKSNGNQKFIFEFDTKNLFDTLNSDNMNYLDKCNLITVSSKDIIPACAEMLSLPQDLFLATGSICVDALSDNDKHSSKIIKKNKILKGKEIILYIPADKRIECNSLDYDSLSAKLKDNQAVITTDKPEKQYPNILHIEGYSIRELMQVSDMMITDYSPAVFEYAVLDKPMVFFCPDMNINNVGYCLHYPEDVPSYIMCTQDELHSFLADKSRHTVCDKQKKFAKKYMSRCDGKSAQRLAKIINAYMEVK